MAATIVITKCTVSDWKTIMDISRLTFAETFEADNTPEDMEKYLQEHFNEALVKQELSNPDSLFYIAELDGVTGAYMKLNKGAAQTERDYPNSVEVQRIYVAKAYKGKRLGSELMKKAIEWARELHVEYIWLGVWEFNPAAIAFYKKFGF